MATLIPAYAIGASTSALVSLESLGIPTPKASAPDYEIYVTAGDGTRSGQGWLSCEWRFAYLTLTQAAILEGYEGACGVCTLTHAGLYVVYSAILTLPPRRSPKVNFLQDYVATFYSLVVPT